MAKEIPALWSLLLQIVAAEVLDCVTPGRQLLSLRCGSESGDWEDNLIPLLRMWDPTGLGELAGCDTNCFFFQIRSDMLFWLQLSQVKRFQSQLFASVLLCRCYSPSQMRHNCMCSHVKTICLEKT